MIRTRITEWAFWALLVLFLLPLVLVSFLPSEDGPTHMYNSGILEHWLTGQPGWLHGWLMLNPALPPNVLGHVLAGTFLLFCSVQIAEKLVVALYIIGLTTGFRFAIRSVARDSKGLELLIFLFVFNSHLHWGFYNFCLSIALLLWTLGVYLRTQEHLYSGRGVLLAGLVVSTVLASPVGFGEALICLGVLELLTYGIKPKRLAELTAICLPAVAIYVWFMLHRLPSPDDTIDWPSVKYAAAQLVMLLPVATWGVQFWLAKAVAIFYVAMTVVVFRSARPVRWRFAILSLVTAAVVFVAPASATGGTMITPRLAYMPYFAWTFWMADNLRAPVRFFTIAVTSLALILLGVEIRFDSSYGATVRRFLANVPSLPEHSTLWFQTLAPAHSLLLDAALHGPALSGGVGGYVAARDRLMLLDNYEAHTNHFPLHFRPGKDAFQIVAKKSKTHDYLNCEGIAALERAGEAPDYILQWGDESKEMDFRTCGYDLISNSNSPERLDLFKKRPGDPHTTSVNPSTNE